MHTHTHTHTHTHARTHTHTNKHKHNKHTHTPGEDPEQLLNKEIRPKLASMQAFLDRPLSLSMDRSPQARKVLGLLKAIAVGGTAVAGACLLAPASAAALVPTALAAAITSPPTAVGGTAAGVFITSLLQSHTQVVLVCMHICMYVYVCMYIPCVCVYYVFAAESHSGRMCVCVCAVCICM